MNSSKNITSITSHWDHQSVKIPWSIHQRNEWTIGINRLSENISKKMAKVANRIAIIISWKLNYGTNGNEVINTSNEKTTIWEIRIQDKSNVINIANVREKSKHIQISKSWLNQDNVISFWNWIQFNNFVKSFPILNKQLQRTTNCSGINLQWSLEWAWKWNIPSTITRFTEKILSPKWFAKEFNKNAPQGYMMHIQNLWNHEVLKIIEQQLKDGIPVPMIYIPIGWNIRTPHFATIVDIGTIEDGTIIYQIQDSMRDLIAKNWLTGEELLKCLNFQTLWSEKNIKNIGPQTFASLAQWYLWWNTIYIIKKVPEKYLQ